MLLGKQGSGDQYRNLATVLGGNERGAEGDLGLRSSTVAHITSTRESTSGVSLDEEMVALSQYQRAYEASARVLTSVDEMLDVLINRTGLVGR